MSREEVKTAIKQLLDNTPEQVLHEVFDYLQSVQGKSIQSVTLSQNLTNRRQRTAGKIGAMIPSPLLSLCPTNH